MSNGDRQPVGSVGLMRRTVRVFGERLEAGHSIDVNMDREHRTLDPAVELKRSMTELIEQEKDFVYALPAGNAEHACGFLGFQRLGYIERWVTPLRLEGVLAGRLSSPLARRMAARILEPLLALWRRPLFRPRPRDVSFQLVDAFDARFDALWERTAQRLPIAGERTAGYLCWRFGHCPAAGHRIACLTRRDGSLDAYLVYSLHDTVVYINDLLFVEPEHFEWLLAEFLRQICGPQVSAVVVFYLGSPAVAAILQRLGFWKRPQKWPVMLKQNTRRENCRRDRLFDASCWHLTRADIDTDS